MYSLLNCQPILGWAGWASGGTTRGRRTVRRCGPLTSNLVDPSTCVCRSGCNEDDNWSWTLVARSTYAWSLPMLTRDHHLKGLSRPLILASVVTAQSCCVPTWDGPDVGDNLLVLPTCAFGVACSTQGTHTSRPRQGTSWFSHSEK